MTLPTPEQIDRAAKNWSDTYRRKVFALGYQDSFFAGANWHRQQVEPLLERVNKCLEFTVNSLMQKTLGPAQSRIEMAIPALIDALALLQKPSAEGDV